MDLIEQLGLFYLGRSAPRGEGEPGEPVLYDSKDLTTHAVCVGMTGSGKTGLCIDLLEEAALDGIPALVVDPKGDLGNLALQFPKLRAEDFAPWIEPEEAARAGHTREEHAEATARRWREGLAAWGQDGARIERLQRAAEVAIFTPGLAGGRPLSVLTSLGAPSDAVAGDPDALRERVGAAVSGLLALLGLEVDPLRSREHIVLSMLVQGAWEAGRDLDLGRLIRELQKPPFDRVGVIDLESFFPASDRFELAMELNNLLASPGFAAWLTGEPLDVGRLLRADDGRARVAVLSIAHLSDPERMFFVTMLLNEVVGWMRAQAGTQSLRAILYMDEVFGYLPPTANPPSKLPLLTLLKQARAFGVGVVLATQNPVDLDYKALSNAGTWFLGRLQTERDKARVLDGLEGAAAATGSALSRSDLDRLLAGLGSRRFLMHNVRDDAPVVFESRWALSYLRGPLTREQLRGLARPGPDAAEPEAAPVAETPAAGDVSRERPVLADGIEECFLEAHGDPAPAAYAPALLVEATVHHVRAALELDRWESVHLLVPFDDDAPCLEEATSLPEAPRTRDAPAPGARFRDLASAATRPASYKQWGREVRDALYRDRTLELARVRSPVKLLAEPDEEPAAFQVRLREALHEARDVEVEKLRARFAPRLESAKRRIRDAEVRLEKETDQYEEQRLQTVVSIGATVLGAVLGRRLGSVGSATAAARRAGRTSRERGDVGRAEERIAAEQTRLEALERDFSDQLEAVRARFDPDAVTVDSVRVPPRKSDLVVGRVALAWRPLPAPSDPS